MASGIEVIKESNRKGTWWKLWRDGCRHKNATHVGKLDVGTTASGAMSNVGLIVNDFLCPECGLETRSWQTCVV